MLRFALLVLLLANAGYLAWTQGWMATLGWTPAVQSEPQRLARQVRPDVLSVVREPTITAPPAPAPEAAPAAPTPAVPAHDVALPAPTAPVAAAAAAPEPLVCLQTESMDEAQANRLRQALRQSELPASSWEWQTSAVAGRWMVYVGKFANETALEKRRAELRTRKIGFDRAGGSLEPGLSLGRFSTEEAATRELTNMLNQGVRGARVVQERAAQTLYTLRLAQLTPAQRRSLQALRPAFAAKPLRPCGD